MKLLESRLDDRNLKVLKAIDNDQLLAFVADSIELCNPDSVWVGTDTDEDWKYNRQMVLELEEERHLKLEGHTIHFDGFFDQGRDREATKYLVPQGETLSKTLNQKEREEGLSEVRGLMKDSMKGRTMVVRDGAIAGRAAPGPGQASA